MGKPNGGGRRVSKEGKVNNRLRERGENQRSG